MSFQSGFLIEETYLSNWKIRSKNWCNFSRIKRLRSHLKYGAERDITNYHLVKQEVQLTKSCQLLHLKKLEIGEWPRRSTKVVKNGIIRKTVCHFLLVVCSNSVAILHHFRDIYTYRYATACHLENSSNYRPRRPIVFIHL